MRSVSARILARISAPTSTSSGTLAAGDATDLPPCWGRWPAGRRGVRRIATQKKKIRNRGKTVPVQCWEICSSCSTVSGLTPSGSGSTTGWGAATGAGGTDARAAQAERVARARRTARDFMKRALGGRCGSIAAADEPAGRARSSHP